MKQAKELSWGLFLLQEFVLTLRTKVLGEDGLKDSKALSAKRREFLSKRIEKVCACAIAGDYRQTNR